MDDTTKSLIFIPDISGFTQFVSNTEIEHSRHIISELIEIIIKSNKLDLTINEIEGDAVLFYRIGAPPHFNDLFDQVKSMFSQFHSHIKLIERDNVCQCGACTSVTNLSLKFVTHYGELRETGIQNFTKLVGKDVIIAHRLLKNQLPLNEYLLMTKNYIDSAEQKMTGEEWIKMIDGSESYDNFGSIPFKYVSLVPLVKLIPDPPPRKKVKVKGDPLIIEVDINLPIKRVHQYLTDPDYKPAYTDGLRGINKSSEINRVSSGHVCVFDDFNIEFTTLRNQITDQRINYVEKGDISGGISFISEYILAEPVVKKTKLTLKLFPESDGTYNKEGLRLAFNNMSSVIQNFKKFCENNGSIID